MPKITPFLWFDNNAEEAIKLYTSLFENSKILGESRYGEAGPGPAGTLMTATIELDGQQITLLNGGPEFKFNESFSFYINCESQEEVDRLWQKLTENGGEESQCGWLKDRFGLSWQVIPKQLMELLSDPNPEKSKNVMMAMLQMKKINVAKLEAAAAAV
jgi:predicted 3-demethylubiquinone-9 3-methyltransferase (glyoxalase superfamily)